MTNSLGELVTINTEEQAVQIFEKLIKAVTHMHQKGYCHRNISMDNVCFSQTGEPLITSFDFACADRAS